LSLARAGFQNTCTKNQYKNAESMMAAGIGGDGRARIAEHVVALALLLDHRNSGLRVDLELLHLVHRHRAIERVRL